jgi:hypothetical protein
LNTLQVDVSSLLMHEEHEEQVLVQISERENTLPWQAEEICRDAALHMVCAEAKFRFAHVVNRSFDDNSGLPAACPGYCKALFGEL